MAIYTKHAVATAELIKRSGYEVKLYKNPIVIGVVIEGAIYYADVQPIEDYDANCRVKYRSPAYLEIIGTSDRINVFQNSVRIYDKVYSKLDNKTYQGRVYNNRYLSHINAWARFDKNDFMDMIDDEFMPVKEIEVNIKNDGNKLVLTSHIYQNDSNVTLFVGDSFMITEGKYSYTGRNDLFKYANKNGELFAMLLNNESKEVTLHSATQIIKLTCLFECLVYEKDGLYNGYLVNTKKVDNIAAVYYYNYTFFTYCTKESKFIELEARSPVGGIKTKPAPIHE